MKKYFGIFLIACPETAQPLCAYALAHKVAVKESRRILSDQQPVQLTRPLPRGRKVIEPDFGIASKRDESLQCGCLNIEYIISQVSDFRKAIVTIDVILRPAGG